MVETFEQKFPSLKNYSIFYELDGIEEVKKHMRDPNSMEFPWRYTIGKELVWRRWDVLRENAKGDIKLNNSLRLTVPPSNKLKEEFKVELNSTIL